MNIFQRLIASIFGSTDPEVEKRRMLKNIAKTLSKTRFKFYKFSGDEVLVPFAKLFYGIYKIIAPAQAMFQSIQNPNAFKTLIIQSVISDKQRDLIEKLDEEYVYEQAKKLSLSELENQIKSNAELLFSDFDMDTIKKIDGTYNKMMLFKAFCEYDYYFLLKKFDSNLREREFSAPPRFENISGEYIADDLKDFISIAWPLQNYDSWNDIFSMLKEHKGVEPISQSVWTKILSRIKELQKSRVLDMMLQLVLKDPGYEFTPTERDEHIIEPYLDKIRQQAESILVKIKSDQKSSKIDSLVTSIFGTTAVVRLKNYTETASLAFERKNAGSYMYQQPLNYMKAFLLDYLKKNIREFSDLVLVRGQWATAALSVPMSNAYHGLLELSDKIIEFDDTLADDTPLAAKLKNLVSRCERDRDALNILHTVLNDTNDKARSFLLTGTQHLILLAKNIKMLLDDHEKAHPEILINWKELEHFADQPVKQQGIAIYKQIYQFVTLMQSFLSN